MAWTKLWEEIVTSSVWSEDDKTRILWITMLATAKPPNGYVPASVPGLAALARISIEDCAKALGVLTAPDIHSRSKYLDGIRIKEAPGGWVIVNYHRFRSSPDPLERNSYMASYMREYRARQKAEKQRKQLLTPIVNTVNTALAAVNNLAPKEDRREKIEGTIEEKPNPIGDGLEEPAFKPTRKLKKDRHPTTEPAKRIASLFRRRLTTPWSDKEIKAFKAIGQIDLEDLSTIERYYEKERAKGEAGLHRRDLSTFLNNYPGELDRANLATRRKRQQSNQHDDNTTGPWMTEGITEAEWRQKHEHQVNGTAFQR